MEVKEEKRKMIQIEEHGIWGIKSVTIPTFRVKKFLMSADEYKMYRCLEEIYKESNIRISVQVALNQILEANTKRYYADNPQDCIMNKFKGLSIDYVLFDIKTSKILCCIELNGKEHETDIERIERDNFLKETFELLDVPLIMIKSQEKYIVVYYENTIEDILLVINAIEYPRFSEI